MAGAVLAGVDWSLFVYGRIDDSLTVGAASSSVDQCLTLCDCFFFPVRDLVWRDAGVVVFGGVHRGKAPFLRGTGRDGIWLYYSL